MAFIGDEYELINFQIKTIWIINKHQLNKHFLPFVEIDLDLVQNLFQCY